MPPPDLLGLADSLNPEGDGDRPASIHTATVTALNADGTVDVEWSDGTIPAVDVLAGAPVTVGGSVQLLTRPERPLVLGQPGAAGSPPRASIFRANNLNINSGTHTLVGLGGINYTAGMTHTGSALSVDTPGLYLVTWSVIWDGTAPGGYLAGIRVNGSGISTGIVDEFQFAHPGGSIRPEMQVSAIVPVTVGDTIEGWVLQNTGGAVAVIAADNRPRLDAHWLSPAVA